MTINKIDPNAVTYFEFHCDADDYQAAATGSAFYPGQGTIHGLMYAALGINGEAGEVADIVKKAARDGNGELSYEQYDRLVKEIGDVIWYCSAMCNELDISLSSVMARNLRKLLDRQERGKLSGSGDNR